MDMEKRFNKPSDLRVVYMGTPSISAIVFQGLIEEGYNIVGLICNEDKATGRKGKVEMPATKVLALAHDIPVFQPHRIRLDYEWLKDLKPDVIVTMAYGQIVPQGVLDIPVYGCLNLHGSLLPELRGAAPIQKAIMEGKTITGVTLQKMADKMDAGVMYSKEVVEIEPKDNYTSLALKIGEAAKRQILRDLLPYVNGELVGEEQDETKVTFAMKIKPEDEHLPLDRPMKETIDLIRGLSETPGGYWMLRDLKLKVYEAHIQSNEILGEVGEIVSDHKGIFLQLQDGVLSIDRLQLEGKKAMDAKSFVNGQRDLKGLRLE